MNDEQKAIDMAIRSVGFGGLPTSVGAGCADGGGDSMSSDQPSIRELLGIGAPTLALARARGDLGPWGFTLSGEFPVTTVGQVLPNLIAENGNQVVQDAYVRGVTYRITNEGNPNATPAQPFYDFFYNFQNGIQFNMRMEGRPGSTPVNFFSPISSLPCSMGRGWVLRYSEQPTMDLQNILVLPTAPLLVQVTFCLWSPKSRDEGYRSSKCAVEALREEFGLCQASTSTVR